MSLTINEIEERQGSDEFPAGIKEIITILLGAINDWPKPIGILDDYENELFQLLGGEIDRNRLKEFISKIDYSKNAWEAESLYQLLEVYNYYGNDKTLKEILKELESII